MTQALIMFFKQKWYGLDVNVSAHFAKINLNFHGLLWYCQ